MIGLVFTLVLVAVVAFVVSRTRFGYDMVTSGHQTAAAVYSGVNARRTIVATMSLSGAVAGFASAIYVLMFQGKFLDPANTHTYGYDAIAVSLLAANNPLGVLPAAALLFGGVDMLQGQLQTFGIDVSTRLLELLPYVAVIVVLAGWGRTRVPSSVGEPYESEK